MKYKTRNAFSSFDRETTTFIRLSEVIDVLPIKIDFLSHKRIYMPFCQIKNIL